MTLLSFLRDTLTTSYTSFRISFETGRTHSGQFPNKYLELAVKHLNGLSGLIGSLQGIESGVRASLQSELDAIKDIIKDAITADA